MRSGSSSRPEWDAYARAIGTNIQRQRVARGYSQDRVAYEANLSRYTYQKLEKGESRPGTPANPSVRTLLAVAQVLGVGLAEILPGDAPDLSVR
ncbi:helix-turn-helix domain-containing protein [Microbacterium sp. 179-I 1D1 NHS]|uniref:helix-turn-helix domain-containing protein n=1 Tax=Microbacterium sp. 179-I 1D1 NHS TaxID=3374298 RepID=UPI00387A5EAC